MSRPSAIKLKVYLAVWSALLILHILAALAWPGDRAPGVLFLGFTAVCVPLFAFSYDLFVSNATSSRFMLFVPLMIWSRMAMVVAQAIKGERAFSPGLRMSVILAPPMIALVMLAIIGKRLRANDANTRTSMVDGT